MKKKCMKKMAVSILLSVVVALGGTMTTFADSSASGSIGGQTVSGSITMNLTSATAKTICTRPASITAIAQVYYGEGIMYFYSTEEISVSGGTAVATVSRKMTDVPVVGGKGTHSVYFGSYSWRDTTDIGYVSSNAHKL